MPPYFSNWQKGVFPPILTQVASSLPSLRFSSLCPTPTVFTFKAPFSLASTHFMYLSSPKSPPSHPHLLLMIIPFSAPFHKISWKEATVHSFHCLSFYIYAFGDSPFRLLSPVTQLLSVPWHFKSSGQDVVLILH